MNYDYLKKSSYYLTNYREVEKNTDYKLNNYNRYCNLKYNEIDKIVFRNLKLKNLKLFHIDFYTEEIQKDWDKFCFIKKVNKETHKEEAVRNPSEDYFIPGNNLVHRFYFIENYDKIRAILLRKFPNKTERYPVSKKFLDKKLLLNY